MTVDVVGLGKITATQEVLNAILIAFMHQSNYYKNDGKTWNAELADTRSHSIYDALAKVGYYDNQE